MQFTNNPIFIRKTGLLILTMNYKTCRRLEK